MAEEWRSLDIPDRLEFHAWVGQKMVEALRRGADSYPEPVFQGDPLDHAIEEAVDLLFYLFYIKRQREDSE